MTLNSTNVTRDIWSRQDEKVILITFQQQQQQQQQSLRPHFFGFGYRSSTRLVWVCHMYVGDAPKRIYIGCIHNRVTKF